MRVVARTRLAGGPPSLIYWVPGLPRARRSQVERRNMIGIKYIIGTCGGVWARACVCVRARLLVSPLHILA